MLKWIQGGLSAVTGIAEPEYGAEYIHTATDRVRHAQKQPYSKSTINDMKWLAPDHTNVETTTFYYSQSDTGIMGFAQIIHSNIVGLYTQAQFTFRVFDSKNPDSLNLWTSTKLENFRIDGTNFYADNLSLVLSEDGTEYHFKSSVNENSVIDLKFKQLVNGCKLGDDPMTYFGDNIQEPWGTMRHIFWPRNSVTGSIKIKVEKNQKDSMNMDSLKEKTDEILNETNVEEITIRTEDDASETITNKENKNDDTKKTDTVVTDISEDDNNLESREFIFKPDGNSLSLFIMAIQGMKPHHAAKNWNFLYFHSNEHSIAIMEFITPKSYGCTKVSVGILTDTKNVLAMTIDNDFQHLEHKMDDVGWNVPQELKLILEGPSTSVTDQQIKDDNVPETQKHKALLDVKLKTKVERVDVMSEIPQFVKNIVSGVSGTKPYIYQYADAENFSLQIDDCKTENGIGWTEVTFISESSTVTEENFNED